MSKNTNQNIGLLMDIFENTLMNIHKRQQIDIKNAEKYYNQVMQLKLELKKQYDKEYKALKKEYKAFLELNGKMLPYDHYVNCKLYRDLGLVNEKLSNACDIIDELREGGYVRFDFDKLSDDDC
ncbi:unnamed protein product [Ambrosiozyma monospora]|uniref:Unnamed protein product n=1 Tax=Ambrosiozyma monospora TaxID=43982 RepID=A0ACB5STT0_AMBMO|nr:unnamed protein product [Ambrosiozyma monospora]